MFGLVSRHRLAEAEASLKVAQAECDRLSSIHATRVRIGHIPIDPLAMTARARAVEGSIRCEWDGDKLVFYAGKSLTEAEFNAMLAGVMPVFDRT